MAPGFDFLNIHEAAEFLRIKPATLYSWIYQRKIPCRKHGSRVVFSVDELRAWSEKQRNAEIGSWAGSSSTGRSARRPRSSLKTRDTS